MRPLFSFTSVLRIPEVPVSEFRALIQRVPERLAFQEVRTYISRSFAALLTTKLSAFF